MEYTNWAKNNKVAIRNFTEPNDLHDVIKLLIVRLLRRKHPNNKKCKIYTEYSPLETNKEYPDIWAEIGKDIYVYEIQRDLSDSWKKKVIDRYEEYNLIIINMSFFSENQTIEEIKTKLDQFIF